LLFVSLFELFVRIEIYYFYRKIFNDKAKK